MPAASASLSLAANLSSVPPATAFARRGAQAAGLPEHCWSHVDLVVEEILVNIASYAYAENANGVVEISYAVPREGLLSIEIADRGDEYDPLTLREPNLPSSLDDRPVGGLGIFLVRQLTESVDYRRDGGWNRLRIGISAASVAGAAG